MVYFHCVLDYHDSHLDEFVGKIFYDIHFTCINFLCFVFIHQKNIAKLYLKINLLKKLLLKRSVLIWGLTLVLFLRREGVSWYLGSKLYKGWSLCLNVFDFGGRSYYRPWQGSKNVLSTSPGQVDFPAWASNFKTHLNCPVGKASPACHPLTKSLPKTSKKWPREDRIWQPWQSIVLFSSDLFLFFASFCFDVFVFWVM